MSQNKKLKPITYLEKVEHSPKKERIERKPCPTSPSVPVLTGLSTPSKKKIDEDNPKTEASDKRKDILIALRNQTAQILATLDQLIKEEEQQE